MNPPQEHGHLPAVHPGDVLRPTRQQPRRSCCTSCPQMNAKYCCVGLLALVIVAGLILFFVYLGSTGGMHFPNIYIDGASLTQLDWSTASGEDNLYNLSYNLTTAISLRNRNRFFTACYNSLSVTALYDNNELQLAWLGSFCQGHKSTRRIKAEFARTTRSVQLSPSGFGFLRVGTSAGYLPVDLRFDAEIAVKWGSSNSKWKYTNQVVYECSLIVPLELNKTTLNGKSNFSVIKCSYFLPDFD